MVAMQWVWVAVLAMGLSGVATQQVLMEDLHIPTPDIVADSDEPLGFARKVEIDMFSPPNRRLVITNAETSDFSNLDAPYRTFVYEVTPGSGGVFQADLVFELDGYGVGIDIRNGVGISTARNGSVVIFSANANGVWSVDQEFDTGIRTENRFGYLVAFGDEYAMVSVQEFSDDGAGVLGVWLRRPQPDQLECVSANGQGVCSTQGNLGPTALLDEFVIVRVTEDNLFGIVSFNGEPFLYTINSVSLGSDEVELTVEDRGFPVTGIAASEQEQAWDVEGSITAYNQEVLTNFADEGTEIAFPSDELFLSHIRVTSSPALMVGVIGLQFRPGPQEIAVWSIDEQTSSLEKVYQLENADTGDAGLFDGAISWIAMVSNMVVVGGFDSSLVDTPENIGLTFWRLPGGSGSGSPSPTPTPQSSGSPTPTPSSASPTPTPSSASPTPTPSSASPTPTPSSASPTPTPSTASPTPTPSSASSTPTPSSASPTPTPSTASPTPSPSTAAPTPSPTSGPSGSPTTTATTSPPTPSPTSGPSGSPTTTATTSPPTPTPSPTPVCFPADAMVETVSGQMKKMEHVAIGDELKVADGSYSHVFGFTHRDADIVTEHVQLAAGEDLKLEMSPTHLIAVDGKLTAARHVKVGDLLQLGSGGTAQVTNVRAVTKRGLYNPQTLHGNIVVNGIVASTYTTTVPPQLARLLLLVPKALYRVGASDPLFGLLDYQLPDLVYRLVHQLAGLSLWK